ncbi:type II CAAX endopeptidase family protein [Amphibacillus indicireducens]|uniref:CPBP family intramembrane metalloprotease n=1 Tax=Amphibacillus indicireducens TaxID=1076330 RepID=A0ABP7V7J1_9BACI
MRKHVSLLLAVSVLVFLMAPVDLWLAPNYWVKSAVKLVLFVVMPIGLNHLFKWVELRNLLSLKQKGRKLLVIGSLVIYIFIVGIYLIIGRWFDLGGVTIALEETMAINRDNFIFVALYIPIVNAFVEEFFFRGILFLALTKYIKMGYAYLISAGIFSVYHVAIMTNWFSAPLFLLLVFSLLVAGLLFNWINAKTDSIYASYFIHAASNLAINTIGLHLFGLLPF